MDVTMIRKRLTCSQDQFARLLGITQSLISHWERGTREPDHYQRDQLALLSAASAAPTDELVEPLRLLRAGQPALACALLLCLGGRLKERQA